jgi:inner membrane protein
MIEMLQRLLAAIQEVDARGRTASALSAALWDETLHLLTAAIFVVAIYPSLRRHARLATRFAVATLAGGVLIDLDHVPGEVGSTLLQASAGRPFTHSLATVLLLLACSSLAPDRFRAVLLGLAYGVSAHMFRDMATGGISLWWPVELRKQTCPYDYYVLVLAGMLALGIVHARDLSSFWRR